MRIKISRNKLLIIIIFVLLALGFALTLRDRGDESTLLSDQVLNGENTVEQGTSTQENSPESENQETITQSEQDPTKADTQNNDSEPEADTTIDPKSKKEILLKQKVFSK